MVCLRISFIYAVCGHTVPAYFLCSYLALDVLHIGGKYPEEVKTFEFLES